MGNKAAAIFSAAGLLVMLSALCAGEDECAFKPECRPGEQHRLAIPCPGKCAYYIDCNDGVPTEKRCSKFLWHQNMFDAEQLECVRSTNCDWWVTTSTTSTTPSPTTSSSTTVTPSTTIWTTTPPSSPSPSTPSTTMSSTASTEVSTTEAPQPSSSSTTSEPAPLPAGAGSPAPVLSAAGLVALLAIAKWAAC